jgi:two-component system, LuxR family, sensor kinase FixL
MSVGVDSGVFPNAGDRMIAAVAPTPVVVDPPHAALGALGLRLAAFAGGVLVWRSPAFAADLPELEPGWSVDRSPDSRLPGLSSLLSAGAEGHREAVLLAETGTRKVYEARCGVHGDHVYLYLDDAVERIQAQQRHLADREDLLLTSRVLSVGEMASMIAHELNQPIGSIANVLRGLKARLGRDALDRDTGLAAIDRATEQALYASDVIQRIRTFVDQRKPFVESLDLARLARNTIELLDWEIARDRVVVETDLARNLPTVSGDQVMIQQVLVNLARNALEAMRDLETDQRRLRIAVRHDTLARQIVLTIQDSGPGIDEAAAARLFAPFVSSKRGGMGVGLGICRSIVELHRGRLWFTPAPGRGSVFHLALPLTVVEEASS